MKWIWLLSKNRKYLYAQHNLSIRADLKGNVYGGGLFSKSKAPDIHIPTAEELFQAALSGMQGAFPYTTGAREEAAKYLTTQPFERDIEVDMPQWESYQPTSFEQALASQHFANVWPDVERQIKHGLSLSGMATSPILGAQLGKARGELGVDIGTYLSELGQRRAELDLNKLLQEAQMSEQARQFNVGSALGIDPMSSILSQMQLGSQQSALQAQEQLRKWQEEQTSGMGGTIGTLLGAGAGAIAAPFTGGLSLLPAMSMGGALGGQLGSLFGGQSPMDIGTALQIGQYPSMMQGQNLLNKFLGQQNQATKVGDTTKIGGINIEDILSKIPLLS